MPSQTNFSFLHTTPAAPSGFRNTYPQIGGTDPAYISNYYDSIGNVSARTTTTETIAIADQGKLITFTNASTTTATLDSTVPVNFTVDILNSGSGLVQLSPSGGLLIAIGSAAAATVGNVAAGTWGRLYRNETQWYFGYGSASNTINGAFEVIIGDGISTPGTGDYWGFFAPYTGVITSWTLVADVSTSAQITVKKSSGYSGFPTTTSIVAAAPPNLSSQQKNQSSTLTGWTTAFTLGDFFQFNLDSVAACTRLTLSLQLTRSN